ncbi:hypothetical protein LTR37_000399 [Vermiconidia calcicola]|uniref:Uncharacterized protein n=1 Tax=Vermiconidia calcicola TaxID=1690605 RepID=A0ACC3NY61_9PEZI|nr:hypothetical protein LTR37_000399 [Vermiconidia calcicola]
MPCNTGDRSTYIDVPSLVSNRDDNSCCISAPLPPTEDPWYTAPPDYELASPGDVLRIRPAPGNLTTIFSNSSAAYNILFRSTNTHYQPSWAVTTLFVPRGTNGNALVSYQIPYNTVDLDGSPSYLLYAPVSPMVAIVNTDIDTALSYGWYVNVPDFEGPLASFTAGVQSGHAVLDSVRAVLNTRFGLSDTARYAMWGYSGGSLASEWAAELQVQYAPELSFAGAALGGVLSNMSSIIPAINGTMWAGLFPEALLGMTSQYPEAREYLLSQLKPSGPYNRTALLAAADLTITEAFAVYAGQDIYQYLRDGPEFFHAPVIQDVLHREGYMGYHGVPEMPLFIYKAVADEITSIEDTDRMVQRYCEVGANIVYERNTVGGHLAELTNGDRRAFEWLGQVLGGTYEHEGCTIRNVAVNITDSPL